MTEGSPFDSGDARAYNAWRERKLDAYPKRVEDLVVALADTAHPTAREHAVLLAVLRRANMAVYAGPADAGKEAVRSISAAFGLWRLDPNIMADDDGITPLHVAAGGGRTRYIPYTDRPISWHTDGYYNPPDRTVRAMVLHCVRNAAEGGDNALIDHEMLYIRMRDADVGHIRALMQPDVMTIPENIEEGVLRPAQSGPVFSVGPGGELHMRYTARKRSIVWKDAPEVRNAVALLESLLADESPLVFRHRLEPGQGLICNNVPHTRTAFSDESGHGTRLLYRARFYDRIAGTLPGDTNA